MNIGNVIRTKRRAKDMTQEDIAELLGVSVSAVSLWESGKTMPDISLVPAICSLLEISADELFGIDAANRENEIMEIVEEAGKYGGRGHLEEAVKIIEDGLKKFPDSWICWKPLWIVFILRSASLRRRSLSCVNSRNTICLPH